MLLPIWGGGREELPYTTKPKAREDGQEELPHAPTPEARGSGRVLRNSLVL